MKRLSARLLTSVAILSPAPALAAGFAIKEQSATLQSTAFAGSAANAGDISHMYFNGAALSHHDGMRGLAVATAVLANIEMSNVAATSAAGTTLSGGSSGSTGEPGFVPATYLSAQLTEDLTFGMGVNAPFGAVTDYGDTWAGRYHGTRTEMTTINVNPVLSYQVTDQVAIAGGFQAQYVHAKLGSAIDLGAVANSRGLTNNAALIGNADANTVIEGDGWGFGFTLGILAEPAPGLRVGVGFRSEIEHDIDDGTATFSGANAAGTGLLGQFNTAANTFTNGGATTSVSTPAQLHLGVAYDATPELTVMADAHWTQWSSFDELRVDFADSTPDSVTLENWDDSWFVSLGAQYRLNDHWTLSGGLAYDQSPIPDEYRTPRIPGSDRYWLSLGANYALTDSINLGASYAFIYFSDAKLDLTVAHDANNAARGNLSADIATTAHLLSLTGEYRW